MPKPIRTSTRAAAVPRTLAAGAVLVAASLSFACGGKDTGGNRSPIFHTGVNASVIEPGGALPTMPPPGLPRSASAPGQYNQSSRGGGQTSAPTQTASQGSARILPPGGGSAASPHGPYAGAPPQQHGAYGAPPQPGGAYGGPEHAARPQPHGGGGGGMVSIGGATTIDTRRQTHEMKPVDAMARNPLLWPVAAVAWPFQKLSERRSGNASQSHSGGPESAPPPLSAEQLDQLHDREQTLAMERALHQRDNAGTPPSQHARPAPQAYAPPPSPPATAPSRHGAPGSARPSIAEELAALRRGNTTPPEPHAPRVASRYDGTRVRDVPSDPYGAIDPVEGVRQRFDDDGDGRPDREEVYDREGLLAESAEDVNGDGTLDTWTRYRNGAPLRRRADLDGDGMIDAWTYYADGGLDVARLERDTTGDGYRDRIDFFDAGELTRRTEDADGDGFPERVTRFGADGRPAQRDEDSDGDGALDTRSFYEGGRLTRRILLNDDERWEP